MEEVFMLTTLDNPFNPFTQYDEWFQFDVQNGYHTCAYLARIAKTSDELSDEDQFLALTAAINEIIELNITGNYIKVNSEYKPRSIEQLSS